MRRAALLSSSFFLLIACSSKPVYKIPEPGLQESLSGHMLHQSKYAELCKRGHAFVCEITQPDWRQTASLSILQGLTWLDGAFVNVVGLKADRRHYWVATQTGEAVTLKEIPFKSAAIPNSEWAIESLEVPLEGDVHDFLVVGDTGILDLRRIEGRPLGSKRFRFAIASCMDASHDREQDTIWRSLGQDDPDYLFLLGDNVYATKALNAGEKALDPQRLTQQYLAMRRRLELYRLPKLIPTLAIWDDHDFGMKDGDRTNPYRKKAKDVFQLFFAQPQRDKVLQHGPENAAVFTGYNMQIFLLDDRTQRQPNGTDPGEFAHWGAPQEKWLLAKWQEFNGISWLLNGGQFFGAYHRFESFAGSHPQSFAKFLAKWRDLKRPAVLVSGDRHLSEVMEINPPDSPFKTIEVTTSPLHARTYPSKWTEIPNSRQIAGVDLKINFVIVDGQTLPTQQNLVITAKDKDGVALFSKKADIDWSTQE